MRSLTHLTKECSVCHTLIKFFILYDVTLCVIKKSNMKISSTIYVH